MTALKAMTIWPAYQHFEEASKGSIEPGKLADFVILSADPTAVDPETLDTLKVMQTVKKGKVIYRHDDPSASVGSAAESAAAGDVLARLLNRWQHTEEQSGHGTHGHGPELLMGALLQGLDP